MRNTTRRTFTALAISAAIPAAVMPKVAQAAEPDPIFALIEAHRQAFIEFDAALGPCEDWEDAEPHYVPWNAATKALLTTPPTTPAGIAALLEYLNSPAYDETYKTLLAELQDSKDGDAFMPMIIDTVRSLATA
jgi:hypothetical protein